MTFSGKYADHHHGYVFDQHRRAERIGELAEQLLHHGLSENGTDAPVRWSSSLKPRPDITGQLRILR